MFDVDTLFVVSASRGDYVINDMISSIKWACPSGSFFLVVVDEASKTEKKSVKGQYQILHTDLLAGTQSAFHRAAGLKWAIDQGIAYRQVIMLSEECLVMAQPLDQYFLPHTQKDGVGVIGVRDNRNYEHVWQDAQTRFFELGLQTGAWEHAPISLVSDVLILSGAFTGPLYQKKLLLPPTYDKWRGTYGSYISWVCHMLGFYVVSWGYVDKPLPPLYFSNVQGGQLVPPHLLRQQFLIFGPVSEVMSYSRLELRELFKQQRGEDVSRINKFGPETTGPAQQDVSGV